MSEEPDVARMLIFGVRTAPNKVYAIDVKRVLNVLEPIHITPVPLVPALVRGIVSNRGRIVTVVDAGVLLHGADVRHENVALVLVLRDGSSDTGHIGLSVGKIRNLESSEALGDSVTVVDAEALMAELDMRVVRKQQGVVF